MTRSTVLVNARRVLLVTVASFALAAQAQTSQSTTTPSQTESQKPAAKQMPAPQAAFQRADTNKDGRLTQEEAARMPAVAAKFSELDGDKDGSLSVSEFAIGYGSDK